MVELITGQKGVAPFKPSVVVNIHDHYKTKVYTSGSPLSGEAVVTSTRDVPFDGFEIVFLGIAATRLDFVQQFPTHSFRPFLKLRMPIPGSALPESRVFEAGKKYTISFNFVVPHQLTIGACNHKTTMDVREQHLRLPPTMGFWEGDDQAPEMAQIEYSVKARATRRIPIGDRQDYPGAPTTIKLMEGTQMVKVLPALPEDAPLEVSGKDERYQPSKTKSIRKSLFGTKLGKITATASQPGAVMLSADGHDATPTVGRIDLEFAPASADSPVPKINSVSGKLTSVTFFSAAACDTLPDRGNRNNFGTNPSLNYSASTSLFNSPVTELNWKQRHLSTGRRDSGYSSACLEENGSDSDCEPHARRGSRSKSSAKSPPIKYTAALDVPFSVPTSRMTRSVNRKFFLPTFHSCLISRTYTLQLTLNVGPSNTSITLSVPLQLGVERVFEPEGVEALPSFESAMAQAEEEEANAHLRPRLMSVPALELQGTSQLPGYDDRMARRSIHVA